MNWFTLPTIPKKNRVPFQNFQIKVLMSRGMTQEEAITRLKEVYPEAEFDEVEPKTTEKV